MVLGVLAIGIMIRLNYLLNKATFFQLLAHIMLILISCMGLTFIVIQENASLRFWYYLLGKPAQATITKSVPASYRSNLAKNGRSYSQIEFKQIPIRFSLPNGQQVITKVDVGAEETYILTGKQLVDSQIHIRYLSFKPSSVIAVNNQGWLYSAMSWLLSLVFVVTLGCYLSYGVRYCCKRISVIKALRL